MPLLMPSNLGLQVHEERSPDRSFACLNSARTAFVGRTLRGPPNAPTLVRNFGEFQQVFGGLWQPSLLGYAVEQFFDNGGSEALIVRVVNGARAATLTLPAGAGGLTLKVLRPGTREFLRAAVDYDNLEQPDEFNMTLQRVHAQGSSRALDQETYRALSLRSDAPRYVGALLAGSRLVRLHGVAPAVRPDRTVDPGTGLATGYVYSGCDGDDGAPLCDYDLIGSASEQTGVFALETADHFSFLTIPPIARDRDLGFSTLLVAARFCRARHAMLLVDPPREWQTADDALAGARSWGFTSEDACMYFPRILAHDKLRGRFETFAPSGAIAGMLSRGAAPAPAWACNDSEEPVLRPGHRPSCLVPDDRRSKLAALGVNTLHGVRSAIRRPLRARTLSPRGTAAAAGQYLATRRFTQSVLASVAAGTRWTASLASTAAVEAEVERQVRAFLSRLHAEARFGERAPRDAYFVICDARVNPAMGGESRGIQFLVGLAAERHGEFHVYRLTQNPAGVRIAPVTVNRLSRQDCSPLEAYCVERFAGDLDPAAP
jgi:hypothetical protein